MSSCGQSGSLGNTVGGEGKDGTHTSVAQLADVRLWPVWLEHSRHWGKHGTHTSIAQEAWQDDMRPWPIRQEHCAWGASVACTYHSTKELTMPS